jgi:hypothetical protein
MKSLKICGLVAVGAALCSSAFVACTGDDEVFATDGGTDASFDVFRPDVAVPEPGRDAAVDGDAGDAGPKPTPRVLVTMNGATSSELVAVSLASRAIDGRLTFPGFIGGTYADGDDLWLLEQAVDVVAKMDRLEPWKIKATYDVALSDRRDGGDAYSDPVAVVASAGNKAYVLRYTRNTIAVISPSVEGDGSVPVRTIDLSALVSPGDADGLLEMTSAVYVAAKKRLYVTLANIDKTTIVPPNYDLPCPGVGGLASTVVAIDTDTDTLVNLGGTGPGGGIALPGYNVAFGARSFYDPAGDRLLVLTAGCGPFGGTQRAGIDEVKLATGQASRVLPTDTQGYASAFERFGTKYLLGLGGQVFPWDPTKTTLDPAIPNAPSSFAFDGVDKLVGARKRPGVDGGPGAVEIVRVPLSGDGGVETLSVNPFTKNDGFLGTVEVWPRN